MEVIPPRLVLDTSAYAQLRRGHDGVLDWLAGADVIFLPVVVLGELQGGFRAGSRHDANMRKLADLSLGMGPKLLLWMMARARLESMTEELQRSGRVRLHPRHVAEGAWELSLTLHTTFMMSKVVQRDLFLFELDDQPLLEPLTEGKLQKDQTLAFRFEEGSGEVGLDGEFEPMDDAMDVARAYLEFHMLGELRVEHTERRVARISGGETG